MTAARHTQINESEIIGFFAEIDALGSVDQSEASTGEVQSTAIVASEYPCDPPVTTWVEQIDQETGYPFYWNSETDVTSWEMPEAYARYLQEYQRFSLIAYYNNPASGLDPSSLPPPPPPPPPAPPAFRDSGPKKKAEGSVEFLSEYIAYSDSEEEGESTSAASSGSASPESDRLAVLPHAVEGQHQRAGKRQTTDEQDCPAILHKKASDCDADPVSEEGEEEDEQVPATEFGPHLPERVIGPQLPRGLNSEQIHLAATIDLMSAGRWDEEVDEEGRNAGLDLEDHPSPPQTFIGPILPSDWCGTEKIVLHGTQHPPEELSNDMLQTTDGTEKVHSSSENQLHGTIRSAIQILLDKLALLDIAVTSFSSLQILLIQLTTRLDDWECGGLTTERMLEKLTSAQQELAMYEAAVMTDEWACHWDTENKRYFYENRITGDTQWEFPAASITAAPINVASSAALEEGEISDEDDGTTTVPEVPGQPIGTLAPPSPPAVSRKEIQRSLDRHLAPVKSDTSNSSSSAHIPHISRDQHPPVELPLLVTYMSDDSSDDEVYVGDCVTSHIAGTYDIPANVTTPPSTGLIDADQPPSPAQDIEPAPSPQSMPPPEDLEIREEFNEDDMELDTVSPTPPPVTCETITTSTSSSPTDKRGEGSVHPRSSHRSSRVSADKQKKKKTKSKPNLHGGRDISQLLQKWQRVQESL